MAELTCAPRPEVLALDSYKPGKPIEELARELGVSRIVKLASNENPLGPSPLALRAMRRAMNDLHRYPDGGGYLLKKRLSEVWGLPTQCFTLGNGSSEILLFALWAYVREAEEVLTSETSFLMYPIFARVAHARIVQVPLKDWALDLDAMAKCISNRTRVVFLCNPNNPTGTIFRKDAFARFLKAVPDKVLVVVDEAYAEFVEDTEFPDAIATVRGRKNLLVLRTFSKIAGLAGLRVGYGISDPEVAGVLDRVRPPFNTSSVAQAAALGFLEDASYMQRSKDLVRDGRAYLKKELEAMGVFCLPSSSNFMMVRAKGAKDLYGALLKRGVIVRSMGCYGLEDWIRVTVGTKTENRRLVAEWKELWKP